MSKPVWSKCVLAPLFEGLFFWSLIILNVYLGLDAHVERE
jgi:hypothetical protein